MKYEASKNYLSDKTDRIKYGTINAVFDQKEKYLIIALTGKVGAGCSTIAKLFQSSLEDMKLSYNQPGIDGFKSDEEREYRVLQRFFNWHQKRFYVIKVRDVILSFLLKDEHTWEDFLFQAEKYRKRNKKDLKECREKVEKRIKEEHPGEDYPSDLVKYTKRVIKRSVKGKYAQQRFEYVNNYLPELGREIHSVLSDEYTEMFQYYGNQLRFFGTTLNKQSDLEQNIKNILKFTEDRLCNSLDNTKKVHEKYFQCEKGTNTIFTIAERINLFIKALEYPENLNRKEPIAIIIDSIKNIYESNYLKDRYTAYYLISANRDEQLRKHGIRKAKPSYSQEQLDFVDLNEQPKYARKKLRTFAQILINIHKKTGDLKKNPFVREYIEAIAKGDNKKLLSILLETKKWEQQLKDLKKLLKKESKNSLDKKYQSSGILQTLHNYYCRILRDPLRIYLYISGFYSFFLQDVETCIQNADIFLANNEETDEKKKLCQNIVRYVSLMMHPGLIPPTPIERCMQIAYTAKVNSGCISRQVGAVVTDSEYQILSLGWNDVPCGQTSCALRNLIDVSRGIDSMAYSEYEIGKGSEFKKFTQRYRFKQKQVEARQMGLPISYCFKSLNEKLTGEQNPMEARSMHGEEKALLVCDQEKVKGGYLFTTSSPCVMCSKSAKEHHIKKIYYIEPYPGISQSHVCNSGDPDNRAQYELFEGAIGRAYTQLYTPIMPYKDELEIRGVPEKFLINGKQK